MAGYSDLGASLRGTSERAVDRSERDGHGRAATAGALILLALCGIGFAGVAVAVAVSGAESYPTFLEA
jgi:hypothetical protein